jgi:hypothetical protein
MIKRLKRAKFVKEKVTARILIQLASGWHVFERRTGKLFGFKSTKYVRVSKSFKTKELAQKQLDKMTRFAGR